MHKLWVIYILVLNNNAFYTGITNNLNNRLATHKSGRGSKYVRAHLPFRVIYIQEASNRSEASKVEASIKKLSRKAKETMLKSKIDDKILLFCESCGVTISLQQEKYKDEFDYQCMMCNSIIHYKSR